MKTRGYVAIIVALLLIAGCEVAETETGDSAVTEMKSSVVESSESAVETIKAEPVKVAPVKEKPAVETPKIEPVKEVVAVEPKEAAIKPEAVEKPAEDKVVVTVNEVKIMQSHVDEKLNKQIEARMSRMQASGRDVSAEQIAKMRESMKKRSEQRIISRLIDEQLIKEKLAAKSIVIGDDKVEEKIAEIAEQQKVSRDELLAGAAKQGLSEADAIEYFRRRLGLDKLIEAALGDEANITDEDAKKQYDENAQRFSTPEQVRASHILAGSRGITDEERPKMRVKIEEVAEKLKAGGNFEDLAREHSDCPSSGDGGDLKTFFDKTGLIIGGRGGRMDVKFAEAAFALEIGQVSDIVETPFGYHIIKATEHKEAKTKSFEEAKEEIKKNLANRKKGKFFRTFQQTLKDEAKIEYAEGKEPPARPTRPTRPGAAPGRPARPPRPPKPPAPPKPTEDNK